MAETEACVRLLSRALAGFRRSLRAQLARGKVRRLLQRRCFCAAQPFLEGFLRGLPLGPQPPQLCLPLRGQYPVTLAAVTANGIRRQAALLDQRQSPGGGSLVDADRLGELGSRQIGGQLDDLQRRVLRGMQSAVPDHLLIEYGDGSGSLAQRRAVTGKRLQFHGLGYYMYMHTTVKRIDRAARGQAFGCRRTAALAWTPREAHQCRREYLSQQRHAMTQELSVRTLLSTETVVLRDVLCSAACQHRGAEEWTEVTHLVFPYRGVYVRHLGRDDAVAEANQVLFFNEKESYRISHPLAGGDASLSLTMAEPLLRELAPKEQLRAGGVLGLKRQRLPLDPRAQALAAVLRHSLSGGAAEPIEAESRVLRLIRRSLGERTSQRSRATIGLQKLADRAKLVVASDPARRWTLAEIAAHVRVSPVYLTQVFQQVEGIPLYRYQLRLRLARALDLLDRYHDLAALALDLGFSSHSHFSAAFRHAYGRAPSELQRSARLR